MIAGDLKIPAIMMRLPQYQRFTHFNALNRLFQIVMGIINSNIYYPTDMNQNSWFNKKKYTNTKHWNILKNVIMMNGIITN